MNMKKRKFTKLCKNELLEYSNKQLTEDMFPVTLSEIKTLYTNIADDEDDKFCQTLMLVDGILYLCTFEDNTNVLCIDVLSYDTVIEKDLNE